jgi:hypothetical protein
MSQRTGFPFLSCVLLSAALLPVRAAEPATPSAPNADAPEAAAPAPAPKPKAKTAAARPARKRPARAARKTAPAPQARSAVKATKAMQETAAAPLPADDTQRLAVAGSLADFGAVLHDGGDSAETLAVLPGSEAAALGLRPEDRLVSLNGVPARSRVDVKSAWQRWDAGLRLWAVSRRGLRLEDLRSRFPDEEPAFSRSLKDLSPREAVLKDALLERSARSAQGTLDQAPPLQVSIPARQILWVRFPDGILDTVATGDILPAEVTMEIGRAHV